MTDSDPAWEVVHEAILAFGMKVPDLGRARAALVRVIREKAWKSYMPPIGERCEPLSFAEWVIARIPRGLETTVKNLQDLAQGDTDLAAALEQALEGPTGVYNIHTFTRPSGTSESAALRRLRNQRPDLYAKVLDGELSAHAAAIKAGFRPKTFTVRVDDPVKIAQTLRHQLTPDVLRDVAKLIVED